MMARIFGSAALAAGLLLIGTALWPFRHANLVALGCGLIVAAHALYTLRTRTNGH